MIIERFKGLIRWFKGLIRSEQLILCLTIVGLITVVVFLIKNSTWSNAVSSLATLGLLALAGLAARYARRNIETIKLGNRNALFLQLMNAMGETKARDYRGIIHEFNKEIESRRNNLQPVLYYTAGLEIDNLENNIEAIKKTIEQGRNSGKAKLAKDAIEETIALMDRVGFFLLHGKDEKLVEDAPHWILNICRGMDEIVGDYLRARQTNDNDPTYGAYFVELADKSKEMELGEK